MKNISKIAILILTCFTLASCASNSNSITQSPGLFSRLTKASFSAPKGNREFGNTYSTEQRQTQNKFEKYKGRKQAALREFGFEGAKKEGDGYSLNFNNADLSELSKVILWDTLKIPYLFDPRVKGQVTLATGKAISKDDLLFTYETILQMNNAAMVKEGKLYRIVPASLAQSGRSLNVDYAGEKRRIGPGYGVTIFPLKYVSTDVMKNILSSITNKQNGVKSSIDGNILFIRGPGRERKTLVELALSFDVDWMKGQSAGIYVLDNTSPDDLIPELQDIFKTKNGRGKGIVRFQSIGRLNAILVLTENPDFLDKVESWVKRLDRTNGAAENLFVYRVENGKAKELTNILNQMFTGQASTGSTGSDRQTAPDQPISQLASQNNPSVDNSQPDQNNTPAPVQASNTPDLSTSSSGSGSTGSEIKIIADEVNNKILIKAANRDYRRILKVLKRIDRAPVQVMINATLAEVTLNDQLKYGVQFFLQNKGGNKGAISFSTGNALQVAANQFPGLNFVFGSITQPKVVLDALASQTNVKVVSSPSVVVLHNQVASLQVGNEVPIATRQATSITDSQAPIVNEIRFRKTGVILKVTPRVSSNGLVTMEIDQEISSVNNVTAVGDAGAGTLTPTISQRRVSSTIAVNSGQMVVLGGLISERDNNLESGIPGVRKIPVLGKVVGANNNRGKTRTELVIFLQPTVIRNAQDAANIAENVRASLARFAPTEEEKRQQRSRDKTKWKTVKTTY